MKKKEKKCSMETTGTIIKSRLTLNSYRKLVIKYEVRGESYTIQDYAHLKKNQIFVGVMKKQTSTIKRADIAKGAKVRVFYNPIKPEDAYIVVEK